MSCKTPPLEDEILDAVIEDERAALIAQLRERGQSDDEQSWLSLAQLTHRGIMPATRAYAKRVRPLEYH